MKAPRACVVALGIGLAMAACGSNADDGDAGAGRQTAIAKLAARPLALPAMPPDGRCPLGATVSTTLIAGAPAEAGLAPGDQTHPRRRNLERLLAGPVYGVLSAVPRVLNPIPDFRSHDYSELWPGAPMTWISRPSYRGPVVVRGGQLDGAHRLAFGSASDRTLRLELPTGTWHEREDPPQIGPYPLKRAPRRWRAQPVTVRVPSSGCYAFQVDGIGFSYPLVFAVAVNPPDPD